LVKTQQQEYITSMKRNPDGAQYKLLLKYLELRIGALKDQLLTESDMDEIKRIQGRGLEINDMLKALTRKPVVNEFDGAYGQ